MKKVAADLIASEMFRLLKKASDNDAALNGQMLSDNAHDMHEDAAEDDEDMADDMNEDLAEDDEDMADDELRGYLMDHGDESDDDASYVDNEIESMHNMAHDDLTNNLMRQDGSYEMMNDEDGLLAKASDMRLMTGLGRIEASLRNKGEGFAADLVRATASSIKEDIVKEASQRTFVVKNLVKMASDLDRRGNREAARMVKSTIMKINR